MVNWQEFLMREFYGNTIQDYLIAIAVIIASIIIMQVFKFYIIKKLKKLAKKTKTNVDDMVIEIFNKLHWPFYLLIALYIGIRTLSFPELIYKIANAILLIAITYYVAKSAGAIIEFVMSRLGNKKSNEEIDKTAVGFMNKLIKIVIWVMAILLILSNLGYNITTLIAGLGIGGLAIAFALQNVLADVFASISIYFDKPFKVGDFIIIGDDMGIVKKVGIKTTRIQTLQGQELIVSNRELTETRINNYKRMEKRRVIFSFGVVYNTNPKNLEKIKKITLDIINKTPHAKADRVHFKSFGDFSLNFEAVYYVDSQDYNLYMDVQEKINLGLSKEFAKEKIEFAYPTQTIYLNK